MRLAGGVLQLHIDEIEVEHAKEGVEQGVNYLGWLLATPNGGKGENAGEMINAALKAPDLPGGLLK